MKNIFCAMFGHQPPVYNEGGWYSPGEIVSDLQRYISGYCKNEHFHNYSDEIFLDDIIYGLGTAYSQDNEYAQGALKFRKELQAHLTKRIKEEDPEWLNQN